ncbi:hypothetical protein G3O06_20910 [Burkholderia sp. Ac-20345]|nr:hypothetical protein [Burkholderia sp. Ac-20345]
MKLMTLVLAVVTLLSTTLASASTDGVPVLRVTAPNGQQSILVGSIHVPIEGLREPAQSIFNGARHYVIEHIGLSSLRPNDLPKSGARVDWAKSLTDKEVNTYLQRATCVGLTEATARKLLQEPTPHEANVYAYRICPAPRYALDRDSYMSAIVPPSLALRLEVLENDDWVERQRRMVPGDSEVVGFKWALAHDPQTVLAQTRDDINRGDYDALRAQVLESFGSPQAAADYGRHMVDERNAAWIPVLRRVLDDGAAVVVVGAMHFPGPTGLIALLRREGYTVDNINWPAVQAANDVPR